jgi:glutamate dehydrogenase (NAD(P)+)
MDKRFEEMSNVRIMTAVQELTSAKIDAARLATITASAGEAELVDSGLEDTMISAWHSIADAARRLGTDLRTAAYQIAIDKIAVSYLERGIFP